MKRLINKIEKSKKEAKLLINYFDRVITKIAKKPYTEINECMSVIQLTKLNNKAALSKIKDKLVEKYPDCRYDGIGYRKFVLDLDFGDIASKDGNEIIKLEDMINKIKENIKTGECQSFSKNFAACDEFNGSGIGFIIKTNVQDGLDIMKIVEIYLELFENCLKEKNDSEIEAIVYNLQVIQQKYSKEEEVFSELTDDYEIIKVGAANVDSLPKTFSLMSLEDAMFGMGFGEFNELDEFDDYNY